MNLYPPALLVVALLFLAPSPLPAQDLGPQDLGQGYSCQDGVIFRKGKVVSLGKAKRALKKKISKLGKGKKKKAKKQILKQVRRNVVDCVKNSDDMDDSGGQSPVKNDVRGVFENRNVSFTGKYGAGPVYQILLGVSDDGTNVTLRFQIDGTPNSFTGTADFSYVLPGNQEIPVSTSVENEKLGNVTLTISPYGEKYQMRIENDSIPLESRTPDNKVNNYIFLFFDNDFSKTSIEYNGDFEGYGSDGKVKELGNNVTLFED